MSYDKKDLERRMEGALASLSTEFSGLRCQPMVQLCR